MDGARVYCAKWNKPEKEIQMPHDFTHMWHLGSKTDENRGSGKKREVNKP